MKQASSVVLLILAAAICVFIGREFVSQFREIPPITVCYGLDGDVYERTSSDPVGFVNCIHASATRFLDRDYAESKDLCKTFLTLLTAFLVGSITFSEKIVDVSRSGWVPRITMISCWGLLFLVIAACGAGLALMASAAGLASYAPHYDYQLIENRAVRLFIASGLSFGGALAALLCAGIMSIIGHTDRANINLT